MSDEIHPSHNMQLQNGSCNKGVWQGTFRCSKCKGYDTTTLGGTIDAQLRTDCRGPRDKRVRAG